LTLWFFDFASQSVICWVDKLTYDSCLLKQLTTVNPDKWHALRYDFILNMCSSSNSADLIRLRKRVILVKCKPFVVYFLSLNFCYSIVANLFYLPFFRFFFIIASFPCGKCFLECEGEKTIACDNCDKWFHQKCESLSNIHFSFLGKS
jgi:hypothetical protein